MNFAILDTSVVIKWFHRENEEHLDKALLLLHAYLEGALGVIVPDLLIYEFGNFLRFKSGLKPKDMVESIRALWALDIDVHPVDAALSEQMVQLAGRYAITAYDAAFVALAHQLSVPLVTADSSLHQRVKEKGAVILLAEIEGA